MVHPGTADSDQEDKGPMQEARRIRRRHLESFWKEWRLQVPALVVADCRRLV
jgi:hypothetical protein